MEKNINLKTDNVVVEKALNQYITLDFNNPVEVGAWIKKMCLINDEVTPEFSKAIGTDLRSKGYMSLKESGKEYTYMEKYNNLEQYFALDEDVNELKECLLSVYIGSIDTFEQPSQLVNYLATIFCDRFKDYTSTDKITLLRNRTTLREKLMSK